MPVDLGGHRSSGIAAIAYARLRKHLGMPERQIRVYDPIQQLAVVDQDVLELFGIDTVELGRGFAVEDAWWQEWRLPDGTPCMMPSWVRLERDRLRMDHALQERAADCPDARRRAVFRADDLSFRGKR